MGRNFSSIIVWYEMDLFYFMIDTLITVFCFVNFEIHMLSFWNCFFSPNLTKVDFFLYDRLLSET